MPWCFCSDVGGLWPTTVAQFKYTSSDLCPAITHRLVHLCHRYLQSSAWPMEPYKLRGLPRWAGLCPPVAHSRERLWHANQEHHVVNAERDTHSKCRHHRWGRLGPCKNYMLKLAQACDCRKTNLGIFRCFCILITSVCLPPFSGSTLIPLSLLTPSLHPSDASLRICHIHSTSAQLFSHLLFSILTPSLEVHPKSTSSVTCILTLLRCRGA